MGSEMCIRDRFRGLEGTGTFHVVPAEEWPMTDPAAGLETSGSVCIGPCFTVSPARFKSAPGARVELNISFSAASAGVALP